MQSRAFNTVTIDSSKEILVKSSENSQKIKDEVEYYLNLPDSLGVLFPELLDYEQDYSEYTLKFYPYDNLANLFLKADLSIEEGKEIIDNLLSIAKKFHQIREVNPDKKLVIDFYIAKTLERIAKIESFKGLREITTPEHLVINGKHYINFRRLKKKFIETFANYTDACSVTAIHGDFCFSNILYSPVEKIIKLIDPRGSFGSKGIYGDKHYDYAKLMHCLHGKYDYLVNDKFTIRQLAQDSYEYQIPSNKLLEELHIYYTSILQSQKINIQFIHLIEASLFLSMVPLHYENIERQKIFYLTGLIFLNNALSLDDK